MAITHGGDSNYLIFKSNWYKNRAFYFTLSFIPTLILYWSLQYYVKLAFFPSLLFSFVAYLLIIHLDKIIEYLLKRAINYKNGILGESFVREELDKLPNEYSYFQDIKIPQGHGNIDFVVIGPTGIFTIEVKNKHGRVEYHDSNLFLENKNDQKDLIETKREAVELHKYLETKLNLKNGFIYPVLVFTGHTDIHFGLKLIEDSYIIHKNFLIPVLTEKTSGEYNPASRSILEKELESIAIAN